ncbi:Exodeoxyribonuclease VII large subunit [Prochlorococcus marinus str. SS51]|nr:Exodeoxyribonuclease VII large subunit [Prochlorococcus marinus str. LG]KGG22746.1 Exodeoxyribonuclease VII large subunit [Prochlorococcus marinus str. SS35]KGG32622.1 Exodeoxyribonuclease VII large subunit [Prochlorococcus marinus str. SS51]
MKFENEKLNKDTVPHFSVGELNQAIGNLLSRGFAPTFLLHATVSKAQLKNGHLWLTLTDGKASISAVIWSSSLKNISFRPVEEDGVELLGKLNFWQNRATLVVQVIQIRPTLSTVLRQFEVVRSLLVNEGLIADERRRPLPRFPSAIAIFTSVPSSAYADMLRTAKERWPLTKLLVVAIPVQGEVSVKIREALSKLADSYLHLGVQALVLARGGGSREDLMVFDNEELCRQLAEFPIPVITGLGHEDDLTVADLVADHRSATPTAAIVDLLPSREMAKNNCIQLRARFKDYVTWTIQNKSREILDRKNTLVNFSPFLQLRKQKQLLSQMTKLLIALSPTSLLKRGFCIVRNNLDTAVKSVKDLKVGDQVTIELSDGYTHSKVQTIFPNKKI